MEVNGVENRGRRLDCRGLRVEDSLALASGDQHREIDLVRHKLV